VAQHAAMRIECHQMRGRQRIKRGQQHGPAAPRAWASPTSRRPEGSV
jgi:hypothetical protein